MAKFPFDLLPGFTPETEVGVLDRGMGRMDFAVVIRGGSFPLAKLEDVVVTGGVPGNYRTQLLPAKENAFLYAAAAELFGACKEAYMMLEALRDTAESEQVRAHLDSTLAKMEAALRHAVPPQTGEEVVPSSHAHRPDCGNPSGCNCSVDWDSMR